MRALVTGATGFIGHRLMESLENPVILARNPGQASSFLQFNGLKILPWNAAESQPPLEAFEGIDAVFHLVGEPVAGARWTPALKKKILDSRVAGTRNLVESMSRLKNRPPALISASAVGYYGSRGEEALDETSGPGTDFLAEVCSGWESEAIRAESLGIRVALMRFGLVLGNGGALPRMLVPFKAGIGGHLGNGKQWIAWIHVDDLVALLLRASWDGTYRGAVNCVAPEPIQNRGFTTNLAAVLHRPAFLPVPGFALRALLGGFAEVLLASQRVYPKVALANGFSYKYPKLDSALRDVLGR